jgi:AbrB family looped-hinge helix DNA binding protein
MKTPYMARISSRGQIVIPGPIRKTLGIDAGTTFLVLAQGDTIVLQRLKEPPWQFFDELTRQAERQGRAHDAAMQGFTKDEVRAVKTIH